MNKSADLNLSLHHLNQSAQQQLQHLQQSLPQLLPQLQQLQQLQQLPHLPQLSQLTQLNQQPNLLQPNLQLLTPQQHQHQQPHQTPTQPQTQQQQQHQQHHHSSRGDAAPHNHHTTKPKLPAPTSALPRGWKREEFSRRKGLSNGKYQVHYINEDGRRFKNKCMLSRFMGADVDLTPFDWRTGKIDPFLKRKVERMIRLRESSDEHRRLRNDHTIKPPLRSTLSNFKLPVTIFRNQPKEQPPVQPPTNSVVTRQIQQQIKQANNHEQQRALLAAAEAKSNNLKPRQIFWEKRLEGLNASVNDENCFEKFQLPSKIKPLVPNHLSDESVVRAIVASLYDRNNTITVTGQTATSEQVNKNPAVFLDPYQPPTLPILIDDKDLKRQEERVERCRNELTKILKSSETSEKGEEPTEELKSQLLNTEEKHNVEPKEDVAKLSELEQPEDEQETTSPGRIVKTEKNDDDHDITPVADSADDQGREETEQQLKQDSYDLKKLEEAGSNVVATHDNQQILEGEREQQQQDTDNNNIATSIDPNGDEFMEASKSQVSESADSGHITDMRIDGDLDGCNSSPVEQQPAQEQDGDDNYNMLSEHATGQDSDVPMQEDQNHEDNLEDKSDEQHEMNAETNQYGDHDIADQHFNLNQEQKQQDAKIEDIFDNKNDVLMISKGMINNNDDNDQNDDQHGGENSNVMITSNLNQEMTTTTTTTNDDVISKDQKPGHVQGLF